MAAAPGLQTGTLQCLLDVVDGVLGPDVLATTAIDHPKHPLQQPNDPVAKLGADLNQLTLVQSSGAEAALNVGLVVVRLGLGDAAQVVGVHGQQPQGSVVGCSAPQVNPATSNMVASSSPALSRGSGGAKPSDWWSACRKLIGTPIGGELLAAAIQAFRQIHHRRIQECQR